MAGTGFRQSAREKDTRSIRTRFSSLDRDSYSESDRCVGVCRPKRGRPPKTIYPLDLHYQTLRREMLSTLQHLKLAALNPTSSDQHVRLSYAIVAQISHYSPPRP
jgi:hypothetical protein